MNTDFDRFGCEIIKRKKKEGGFAEITRLDLFLLCLRKLKENRPSAFVPGKKRAREGFVWHHTTGKMPGRRQTRPEALHNARLFNQPFHWFNPDKTSCWISILLSIKREGYIDLVNASLHGNVFCRRSIFQPVHCSSHCIRSLAAKWRWWGRSIE